jgi:prepilin-type N-terminal cleavage/methylation domain-containing protein
MRLNEPDRLRIADCGLRIKSRLADFLRAAANLNSLPNPKSEIRDPKSRGLTLIEVVASTMIVGMLAVATLNGLGAATRSADSIGNRAIAAGLADELMSEIVQLPYSDPNGSAVFGRETGEAASPRSAFDDVDDYDTWTASPPQYRDGTVIPNRTGWRQRVAVTLVTPTNPTTTSGTDQGAKLVRVQIEYKNQVLVDQTAIRTSTDEP